MSAFGYKSKITTTPTISEISTFFKGGLGVAALSAAVINLLGDGTNWELDPGNDRIKYNNPDYSLEPIRTYRYKVGSDTWFSTAEAAAADYFRINGGDGRTLVKLYNFAAPEVVNSQFNLKFKLPNGGEYDTQGFRELLSTAPPSAEFLFLPINAVSSRVLLDAQNGVTLSQQLLTDITLSKFRNNQLTPQLDAAAVPYS